MAIVMYAGLTVATLDMFIFHKSETDGRGGAVQVDTRLTLG